MTWLAFHIYYFDDQTPIIVDCIPRVLEELRSADLQAWHFLRYWTHGSHIRFRIKSERDSAELVDVVRSVVQPFLVENPARASLSVTESPYYRALASLENIDADAIMEPAPNNSLRQEPYEPEYSKYGGAAGVAAAEQLFKSSSEAALVAITDLAAGRLSKTALGYFSMLASHLTVADLLDRTIVSVLEDYNALWRPYLSHALIDHWQSSDQRIAEKLRGPTLSVLQNSFDATSSAIGRHADRWTRTLRSFGADLARAPDQLRQVRTRAPRPSTCEQLQYVLFNYVHMHHNRLGLSPAEEAFYAAIAARLLRERP